jgi:hypothetical protein
MLAEVTQVRVQGLLNQRRPEILESTDPGPLDRYEARVRGAAVQVVLLTGLNPPAGSVRELAIEAIACQTGSEIEYAEYPEQQAAGDVGRGYHLHQRYLELLAELRRIIDNAGGGVPPDGTTGVSGRPRGRFPAPQPYPDPAYVRGIGGTPC